MKFKLTGQNAAGEQYEETVEAPDRFTVYRDVRGRGDTLITLDPIDGRPWDKLTHLLAFSTIPLDEKVIMARNIAAMLEAGLPISRALSVMQRQTQNRRLKEVLNDVINDVKRGGALAAALGKFPAVFPSLMVSMVRAGEESGKLAESLRVVATQLERASTLKKKIHGALIYPAVVICAMIVITILMLIYVVPTLAKTFTELHASLPLSTQLIIGVSEFLTRDWLMAVGILLALIVGLAALFRTALGKRGLDWFLLHVPIIKNVVMETNAARTTRTLASLLAAGVDVVLSLSITRDVLENAYYRAVLAEAGTIVTKGGQISEAFMKHPNLYPPLVSEMIAVGEETGRVADLLLESAKFYEEAVERQTKDLSTIIEPFLILLIGAGVGFFAISMIGPIYSLSNIIS